MAADTYGAKNQPQYSASGAPSDAADLTEVGEYASKVGNRRVGPATDRNNASGKDLWPGLEWFDTTDNNIYLYTGAGWVCIGGVPTFTDVTTFGTGWTALNSTNYKPRIRREGNRCILHAGIKAGSGSTLSGIMTVPLALQPADPTSRFLGNGVTNTGQIAGYELVNGSIGVPSGYGGTALTNVGTTHLMHVSWELDQ